MMLVMVLLLLLLILMILAWIHTGEFKTLN
jgi:hypothetical protein